MSATKNILYFSTGLLPLLSLHAQAQSHKDRPNVIYIMADDLGIGDLGCYGQKQIKTPAIDNLADNGLRFTQHYSGSTVSAPSRCALMTGKHTGHASIRGNHNYLASDGETYDQVMPENEITVASIFKQRDYATACIGKWGLGGFGTQSHPNNMGFDYFFGYLGQAHAHRYYPHFLHENNTRIELQRDVYSHGLIMDKALEFIEQHYESPFFLYLTPTIPHADIDVPEEDMAQYIGKFHETPFPGGGYKAQPTPRAAFAGMVTRLDSDVAKVVDLLQEKGILDNTIIIFTSDNGTHLEGGHDPDYFNSSGPYRGHKRDLYEGGIRTPFIVSWPDVITEPRVSFHPSAFWDFLPTVCDLLKLQVPLDIDGISYFPTLKNSGEQKRHDYLYFEFHEEEGRQAVIQDNWKLIRQQVNNPSKSYYELFNLSADPGELANVECQYPEKANNLKKIMNEARTSNNIWKFAFER